MILLVVVDGLRPDAIGPSTSPCMWDFLSGSAHSLSARSVYPSYSLPCFCSIFSGVPPSAHGVASNRDPSWDRYPRPDLLDLMLLKGLRCAAFVSWRPLLWLLGGREGLELFLFEGMGVDRLLDLEVCLEAVGYARDKGVDFLFVYMGSVDEVGHAYGWMSEEYLRQVKVVDRAFSVLLGALGGDLELAILQSDHGGEGFLHDGGRERDLLVPWACRMGSSRPFPLGEGVSILDTAPTVAEFLGLRAPGWWSGRSRALGRAPQGVL